MKSCFPLLCICLLSKLQKKFVCCVSCFDLKNNIGSFEKINPIIDSLSLHSSTNKIIVTRYYNEDSHKRQEARNAKLATSYHPDLDPRLTVLLTLPFLFPISKFFSSIFLISHQFHSLSSFNIISLITVPFEV